MKTLENLKIELKEAEKNHYELTEAMEVEIRSMLSEYFNIEGTYIEGGNCRFHVRDNERSRSFGTFSISFIKPWTWEAAKPTRIDFNHSSNSGMEKKELMESIIIGKAAQILFDNGDKIIQKFLAIEGKHAVVRKAAYKKYNDLQNEISDMENEMRKDAFVTSRKKVMAEGLTYEEGSNTKLPTIDVRYNNRVSNIVGFKILSYTKSGASATIELTSTYEGFDPDKKEWVPKNITRVYDNVRVGNFNHLFNHSALVK